MYTSSSTLSRSNNILNINEDQMSTGFISLQKMNQAEVIKSDGMIWKMVKRAENDDNMMLYIVSV